MSVIKAIGEFIQNQVLGMKWLNALIGDLLSSLGLDVTGRIGGSVQFFIYDVVKITILLCFLIFLISYIQSFFPPERSKKSWEDSMEYGQISLEPCWVQLHRFVPVHPFHYLSDLQVPDCHLV